MKEIAIISLTRFGDMIQETPLLRLLKRTWPQARITMVAERRFAGILPLIAGIDRVVLLDKEEVADRIVFSADPLEPYFLMEGFIRKLEDVDYDLVINLTFSQMSAFIASLVKGEKKVGLVAGEKGERLIASLWGLYLFTTQEGNNRIYNRMNLVDLFTRLGGCSPDGRPVELVETEKGRSFAASFLAGKGPGGERLVGLQMGASDPVRCWPPEYFARLSDLLREKLGVRTVLFGGPGEEKLAARALAAMKIPAVNAVGATSIEELFSLVKRCSLLVTNDTGTMHFAAAGGVPSLMLCIGPAIFHGTGPYSAGNCAVQAEISCAPCRYNFNCPDPVCRDMLSPEKVFDISSAMLEGEQPCKPMQGVKVFRSYFDYEGHLDWQRWDGESGGDEGMASRYGRMWRKCLDDDSPAPSPKEPPSGEVHELVQMADKGMDISRRIARAAGQKKLPLEELRRLGQEETALADRIKIYRSLRPEHAPMVDFFSLMRDNSTSEEIPAIAEETGRCYQWLKALTSCL